jgi:hypothetical protein
MQCLLCIPLLKVLWRRPAISWIWIGATALAWMLMVYDPVLFAADSAGHRLADRIKDFMYQPWAIPFLLFPLFGMICAGQTAFRKFLARTSTPFWCAMVIAGLTLHATEAIFLAKVLPMNESYLMRVALFVKLGRIVTGFSVFALFIRLPLMRDPFPRVSHYAFGLHFMHPAIILLLSLIELKLFGPAIVDYHRFVVPVIAINLLLTLSITFGLCLVVGRFKRLEFLVV